MKEILKNFNLILGSSSPRRSSILTECGIPFTIKVISIEEVYPKDMPPSQVPEFLAREKAKAHQDLKPNEILLTADSVVICGLQILEKPADFNEAFDMLSILNGNKHDVVTAFCLRHLDHYTLKSVTSTVWFNKMSEEEIKYYIHQYRPYDKAGGYGIQEWIGHTAVSRIEGSYLNIVGLPMQAVYTELKDLINELDSNK